MFDGGRGCGVVRGGEASGLTGRTVAWGAPGRGVFSSRCPDGGPQLPAAVFRGVNGINLKTPFLHCRALGRHTRRSLQKVPLASTRVRGWGFVSQGGGQLESL